MYMVLETSVCFSEPGLHIPKWEFLENADIDHNNGPQGIHNDKRNIVRRGSLKHQREFERKIVPPSLK